MNAHFLGHSTQKYFRRLRVLESKCRDASILETQRIVFLVKKKKVSSVKEMLIPETIFLFWIKYNDTIAFFYRGLTNFVRVSNILSKIPFFPIFFFDEKIVLRH